MAKDAKKWERLTKPRTILSLAAFGAALVILLFMLLFDRAPEKKSVRGSLDGRFESNITMEYSGKILHYRENTVTNYLIIGVDKDDVSSYAGHQNGGQADFILVLSIDRMTRTVTPLMLNRDSMVEMQTYGVFGNPAGTNTLQLCLAQAYSGKNSTGSDNTVKTVEKLLHGIKINHYVELDMSAISLVNDALGGITVTLEDDFSSYNPQMTAGTTLTLVGAQAEYFVRGRMTISDGTNESRMNRQRQYLTAFLPAFRDAVNSGTSKLEELLDVLDGHMLSNASNSVLTHDITAYNEYEWKTMQTLEGTQTVDSNGFAQFLIDENELDRVVAEIWFE